MLRIPYSVLQTGFNPAQSHVKEEEWSAFHTGWGYITSETTLPGSSGLLSTTLSISFSLLRQRSDIAARYVDASDTLLHICYFATGWCFNYFSLGSSCCSSTRMWSVSEFQSYIRHHLHVPSCTVLGAISKILFSIPSGQFNQISQNCWMDNFVLCHCSYLGSHCQLQ